MTWIEAILKHISDLSSIITPGTNIYINLLTICKEGCRSHLRNHKSQTFVHFIFLLLLQTWHQLEDMGQGGKITILINIITTAAIILAITITPTPSSSRTERLALSSPSTGWRGWTMIPKSHWFWRQSIWQTTCFTTERVDGQSEHYM